MLRATSIILGLVVAAGLPSGALAQGGDWEFTPESLKASEAAIEWLAKNQGNEGNWESNDLGLVSLGTLAFMSAGHLPGRGKYGENVQKAVDYVLSNAQKSGLLNIAAKGRDMYNHGLSTFVLTQAYGMCNDRRIGAALDKALKLICQVQCGDGGWDYVAEKQARGHDLSLAVMQAKAIRGAMDSGLKIPQRNIEQAIASVRGYYRPTGGPDGKAKEYGNHPMADRPGRFTYEGKSGTTAMAAAGVVCLQEFGQYDDFRIYRSIDEVIHDVKNRMKVEQGKLPFDAYTMYYVAQALYQVGGERWRENYPRVRDAVVKSQSGSADQDRGSWQEGRVSGKPGKLFGTAVGAFTLNIPNRFLPILQEGRVDPRSLRGSDDGAAPAGGGRP
jgi:hypothetical protein